MDARNILRNRKTGESFDIDSSGSLTPLHTQSVFRKKTDYSQFEQFIQQFSAMLPVTMSKNDREKMLIRVRQENKDISTIINNPQAFVKLMTELGKQIKSKEALDFNSRSITGFLKILGTSLLSAKLNTVFPGLAFLVLNAAPVAAESAYTYFQGQPTGGEDLCAKALHDCIQGYLTEVGQEWKKDLPQIVRIFDQEENGAAPCITQQDMKDMLTPVYHGPNEYASNCSINEILDHRGNLTVMATNVDPNTCDMMKQSVAGYASQCVAPTPSYEPSDVIKGVLAVGGLSGLVLLAFALYKYKEHQRSKSKLLSNEYPLYEAV